MDVSIFLSGFAMGLSIYVIISVLCNKRRR